MLCSLQTSRGHVSQPNNYAHLTAYVAGTQAIQPAQQKESGYSVEAVLCGP